MKGVSFCLRELEKYPKFQPGLAIVQVGNREDSNIYIRNKLKTSSNFGINARHFKFDQQITQTELLDQIAKLNLDPSVHGIIVQLPFDSNNHLNANDVISSLDPNKDVDGLHFVNAGKVLYGLFENTFIPCTPKGCLELIKSTNVEIEGKNAVVVGRSKLVGTPMANLLKLNDATVSICHSKTQNLKEVCKSADILVVAIGKAKMVRGDWIKPGAIVIDCGINSYRDENDKSRICGDVDFEDAVKVAGHITPVPGGVGPMTVSMLLVNTFEAAKRYYEKQKNDIKF